MNANTELIRIGKSIKEHFDEERRKSVRNHAIARVEADVTDGKTHRPYSHYWLTNSPSQMTSAVCKDITGSVVRIEATNRTDTLNDYKSQSISIYKNTKLGEVLTTCHYGDSDYTIEDRQVSVKIHNKATYSLNTNSIREVEIYLGKEEKYRFQYLLDLLNQQSSEKEQLYKRQEEQKRYEQELTLLKDQQEKHEAALKAIRLEEERNRLEEEQRRLEEEMRKKKEEEKKREKEIAELENRIEETSYKIKTAASFVRENVSLRMQHLLDSCQEKAKRSHLYDSVPVLISGGPGTGKTTTAIQRLKFLLSKISLKEYETSLTQQQIEWLTDPANCDNNWIFFSPTDLLLTYLNENMTSEDLKVTNKNTITLSRFRQNMLREYKLWNPDTDGPFKRLRDKDLINERLIINSQKLISDFERFCVDNITNILRTASTLNTFDYSWHKYAVVIKNYCSRIDSIKDLDSLMRLFNSLYDNERQKTKEYEEQLGTQLKEKANIALRAIIADEECKELIAKMFDYWKQEDSKDQEAEDDVLEDDEEEIVSNKMDIDVKLYQQLKSLIKKLALKSIDAQQKISKRQLELYKEIKKNIDILDLQSIAELSWFVKNYGTLSKGIETTIFNQIPRLYKLYRKMQLQKSDSNFNLTLLQKIVAKDNNKYLHPDEQDFLLGFINGLLLGVYKKSKNRFLMMKHKYAIAYKEHCKPVIGIDEATDYTVLDYYFIASFRHYEVSSITLCGDIMQGLNRNGIGSWDELTQFVFPNLKKYELFVSYRQLPTLLDVAKQMFMDDQGCEAPYCSYNKKSDQEPKPLAFVSNDEDLQADWIAHRIVDVYNNYGGQLPSVAIFLNDDEEAKSFVERMNEQDCLNGIEVEDCTGGALRRSDAVRVFRLSEVKGMEFEVVFFHNIDKAGATSSQLIRRYLYVGISRATSHLAATFTKRKGVEDILKYFETAEEDWSL